MTSATTTLFLCKPFLSKRLMSGNFLFDSFPLLDKCHKTFEYVPSQELYKVVFTEDKVREKGGRVCLSLLCLLLFLLKGWAASKAN